MLELVKKGEKLTAQRENQRIKAINDLTDRLDSLFTNNNSGGGLICTIKNTATKKLCGDVLEVDGLRSTGNKAKLTSLYQNNGIQLSGSSPSSSSSVIAFLLEAIPHNGIGRCYVPNVIGANIYINDSSHNYCNTSSTGLTSVPYGEYRIIAKSTGTGEGFAIIIPNQMGHIRGELKATRIKGNSGNEATATVTLTNNIELPNIGCPMLRTDEIIPKDSKVVLSWNVIERKYEIIEAQCPVEEEEEEQNNG